MRLCAVIQCQSSPRPKTALKRNTAHGNKAALKWKRILLAFQKALRRRKDLYAVMISSYSARCALIFFFLPLAGMETWHFSSVWGWIWAKNTQTVSISIFVLMLTNILSIRNGEQVNTKEVNTQKIKAQLQLEATPGIAHQSEEQHCCVFRLKFKDENRIGADECVPSQMYAYLMQKNSQKKQTVCSPWLSSSSVQKRAPFCFSLCPSAFPQCGASLVLVECGETLCNNNLLVKLTSRKNLFTYLLLSNGPVCGIKGI